MTLDANKKDEKILATIQQEYKILAEYKMIESEKLSGIYVIPSYTNSLLWFGVLFGRQGVYTECVFRFSLLLPDNFPDDKSLPTIIFQQDVMHPLVCPFTHALNLSHAFPEWHMGEDHIWQVLKYLQMIFADPYESIRGVSTEVSNTEAAKLLTQNQDEYNSRVRACIQESTAHIYDKPPTDDPHFIVFEKFHDDVHGPILQNIKSNASDKSSTSSAQQSTGGATGLSWVKEGEFKPLSIE